MSINIPCVSPPVPPTKLIFITNQRTRGRIFGPNGENGIEGADAICNSEAKAANLQGEFKAWLTKSGSSPLTTFIRSNGPYALPNGDLVASNFEDLIDGSIENSIEITASGNLREPVGVWIGGDYNFGHCGNWLSEDRIERGFSGDLDETKPVGHIPCNFNLALYCVEQ